MQIIDGAKIANDIYEQLKLRLNKGNRKLVILLATDNPAAHTYVALKQKQAQALGLTVEIVEMTPQDTLDTIADRMNKLADDASVHGIMVQLPLYPALQSQAALIANLIPPDKDVDGLTAFSQGSILQDLHPFFYPATVAAILEAIRSAIAPTTDLMSTNFQSLEPHIRGREILIINHSNLVGKPLAAALINLNATVTIAHEFTADLAAITRVADIIISATGKPGIINDTMIKQGSILIDVTSVKTANGVQGDILLSPALEAKAGWITPVPGGIGPLTVASLLRNLVIGPTL